MSPKLESSIMWDGTILLTLGIFKCTTELCQCIGVVSSMKFPNLPNHSALVNSVGPSLSLSAPSFRPSVKTNFSYFSPGAVSGESSSVVSTQYKSRTSQALKLAAHTSVLQSAGQVIAFSAFQLYRH